MDDDVTVVGKEITVFKIASATASVVADQINGDPEASQLVHASGFGTGLVADTSGFINLSGAVITDGKLVANQAVLVSYGTDTGPGEAIPGTSIYINPGSFDSYAYTANSNGQFPSLAAFIAKGKEALGQPYKQGYYNAYMADDGSLHARFMWVPRGLTIEVPGFRGHTSWRMGLGTDLPTSPLHVVTRELDSGESGSAEAADLRLEMRAPHTATDSFASILFDGRGAGDVETLVTISAVITDFATPGAEAAKLSFKTAHNGALDARWHLARGIWSDNASGGDKGNGAINLKALWIDGNKSFYKDPSGGGGWRLNWGPSKTGAVSGTSLACIGSNMIVTASGSAADLATITNGNDGDEIKLRPATGKTITVIHGSGATNSISCGSNVVLDNPNSMLTLFHNGNHWVRQGEADNG